MPEGRLASSAFGYVETDIPPGMTIAEWRAQRAAHAPRRRTRRVRLLVAAPLALVGRGGRFSSARRCWRRGQFDRGFDEPRAGDH